MISVHYQAPDVLHWLDLAGKASKDAGFQKAKESSRQTTGGSLREGFSRAVEAVKDYGKGAMAERAFKKGDDTHYSLDEEGFEMPGLSGRKRILYSSIKSIRLEAEDHYVFEHEGGSFTLEPVAHLLVGRVKVAIGWKRGGTEVPYAMLAEEVAARSGLKIVST